MQITLHLTLRAQRGAITFTRVVELPAVPVVGEELDVPPGCDPVRVLSVEADPTVQGAYTCEVVSWDDPEPQHRATSLEHLADEIEDWLAAGWGRE